MDNFTTENSSRLRNLAGRLEEAWNSQSDSTKGIDLEPFLPEAGSALRRDALAELVKTDLACRWQRGLPTSLELYIEKFPELGPLDKVSPRLIYEEYRVRTQNGYPAPLSQYKTRFPAQFEAFEGLIQTETSHIEIGTRTEAVGNINTNAPTVNQSPLALLQQGTLVGGHYTLTKRIGTGGFGEVWLGNDIHGNIPKAIKIITRSVESEEAKQELHALEIIKRLNHPYLLRTEGFFAEQERLIVVMELAEGSLREMLKKSKKENDTALPVDKLVNYMKHAAEALDYLHEEGIFHRDIKPENILLVGKIAKVADFGLAKLAQNRQSTKTNFAGTSAYSSPETWKGRVTAKSDLYSLAVTYGELRLGRAVFKGSTIYEFMVEHLQSQPQLDPMPQAEQQVMLRALAKDPSDRFANCSEFIRALEAAVAGKNEVLPSVGKQSVAGAHTPVSKWSTPVSAQTQPSQNLATQYGNNIQKPTSWQNRPSNRPSSAEINLPEMETSSVRRRRKKGPNFLVFGIVAAILLVLGAGAVSLMARASLQGTVNSLVEKREFEGALKAIDNGGILTSPYQEGMRDDVLEKGLELAEKAKKNDNFDDLITTTEALMSAFPRDQKSLAVVDGYLQKKVSELLAGDRHAEAYALLQKVPRNFDSSVKREKLPEITREGLAKAWSELNREDYTAARRITAMFLNVDRNQKEALVIDNLAQAAENVKSLVLKGKFKELMDKIPRDPPAAGKKLAEQLKDEVKTAWLKHAESLVGNGNFGEAQKSLETFSDFFRNDPKGNSLLKSSYSGLLKDYLARGKYEDALNLLARNDFQFEDLLTTVKRAWTGAEAKRFEEGDDDEKARALSNLGKLSKQFATDGEIQDFYSKYRAEYVSAIMPKIEKTLAAKNYAEALAWTLKAEPFVESGQETRLRSMQLLAMMRDPETPPNKREVKTLFDRVMKQPEKADRLDEVVAGVLTLCKNDPAFAATVRPALQSVLDFLPEKRLPPNFYTDSGISPTAVTPPPLGNRKILADARLRYQDQDFDQSLKFLKLIDPAKEDREMKREYYTLFAKLGEKGVLTRDQVHTLEKAAAEFAEIKPYLPKAMAETIAKSAWKTWPSKDDTWAARIADADYSQSEQPIVKAFKAEAILESGKPIDFPLPAGAADEKAYIDYVRALSAASTKKRDDLSAAARALAKLPSDAPWLVLGRRERAETVLQRAANDLLRNSDGNPRLFESAEIAGQAYAWLEKSLQLEGKSAKEAGALPWDSELTLALAAAAKNPPAFAIAKSLGENLLAKHRADIMDVGRVYLVLVDPADFAGELKTLKSGGLPRLLDLNEMIQLGQTQIDAAADPAELNQRQAQLYGLKGWQLEQAEKKNNDEIFAAYNKAYSFDPTVPAVLIARGRFGAEVAETLAIRESDYQKKIQILEKGVRDCDQALKKNLTEEDGWAPLCVARSKVGSELGVALAKANELTDSKTAFLDAKLYADKAVKITPKNADAIVAQGKALEGLANSARIDIDANYDAAIKLFDDAASKSLKTAFNAGRARYRWSEDKSAKLTEEQRKSLRKAALLNLFPTASNPKSEDAAEANYFEGFTQWYQGDTQKAFDSLEKSLALGSKSHKSINWAKYSLEGITMLATAQRTKEPEKVAEWVDKTKITLRKIAPEFKTDLKHQPLFDIAAATHVDLATKLARENGSSTALFSHLQHAADYKHSKDEYKIDFDLAKFAKKNQTALKLSNQEVTNLYQQAVSAIDAAPSLSATEKTSWRNELDAAFKK